MLPATQTTTNIKTNLKPARRVRAFFCLEEKMASKPVSIDKPVSPVVYRDRAFISRTLVMSDGRVLPVSKHRVEALDAEAQAFLDKHPDLERLPE